MSSQRAFTLIEAAVSVALIAVALSGALWAAGSFGRYATHQAGPNRSAALVFADSLLRVAQDAWKYGTPGTVPSGSWQTALPIAIPSALPTSIPITVRAVYAIVATPDPGGVDTTVPSAQVTLSVTYPRDAGHDDPGTLSVQGALHVQAPPPGSRIAPLGIVPAPSGAP
ncbi:MAG TPA: type II secretion system protein [Candidatus Baltobacteraceae bacterium]|jgi:prepilin-type N-terminal cleavage/methylation domain-containing protein